MSKARILVVEDNPAEIVLLRYALDQLQEEYILNVLPDGEAALGFVAEHRAGTRAPEPCVILLDLYLPKHSGLAVLKAIRQEPTLTHIRVMVLSGSANPKDHELIRELGGVYREKPTALALYVDLAAEIISLCRNGAGVLSLATT